MRGDPSATPRWRSRVVRALLLAGGLGLALALGLGALDLASYRLGGQDATITQVLRDVSAGWPFLPPLLSALAGGGFVLLVMHLYPGVPADRVPDPEAVPGARPARWEALPYDAVPDVSVVVHTAGAIWFAGDRHRQYAEVCAATMNGPGPDPE